MPNPSTHTPPASADAPALPPRCPPLPPHPSEYLPPERLAEWYADLEALAAGRGLPPLPAA